MDFSLGYLIFIGLFLLIPASAVGFFFCKDTNRRRKLFLNVVLIGNSFFYFSPLLYAVCYTPRGGNMWSENGPGAALWAYMFVFPAAFLLQYLVGREKLKAHEKATG
jgi:hypothetical protein